MKNLNLKFRKKNKPTDVLSFRLKNKNYIGDIAISFEKVIKFRKKKLYGGKLNEVIKPSTKGIIKVNVLF